jgi:hypothetical protein
VSDALPSLAYFRANEGRWRCAFAFAVTEGARADGPGLAVATHGFVRDTPAPLPTTRILSVVSLARALLSRPATPLVAPPMRRE